MTTLEISEGYCSQVDAALLEKTVDAVLRHQSAHADTEITIVIADDEQLRQLNQEFRDINAPTDVLSFPVNFTDPETEAPYLGDVIISFPYAAQQAAAGGHSVLDELQLLVIHGVLHLLGHDHAAVQEKKEMWTAQREILSQFGLENLKLPDNQ